MTTSSLIDLLKQYELSAFGRPREISFNVIINKNTKIYLTDTQVSFVGCGEGCAGAEIILNLTGTK